MKKNFTILVLLFLFGVSSFADSVEVETAGIVAKNFYFSKPDIVISKSSVKINLAFTANETAQSENAADEPLYYVFNINQDDGYVIIAADNDVSPILSYSLKGHYTNENLPPAYIEWMDKYKVDIKYVKENHLKADKKIQREWNDLINVQNTKSQKSKSEVAPLLTTTWGQGNYYNDLCPYDYSTSQNTLTGCVATAMAQIMKKWNYPVQGSGDNSYLCPFYGAQTANFGATTYDWASMPNSITSANNAVATLIYHCGVSVNMDYGLNVSNAYPANIDYALINYFNYSPAIHEISRAICSDDEWMGILENNLDAGRPIIYVGFNPVNGAGHAFVCDGYDDVSLFHFNWGWSGSYDDFFNLTALNPDVNNFNFNQIIISNIEPYPSVGIPVVTTTSIADITETAASCGGYVISESGSTVTAKGICWSTSQNPTTADSHTLDGAGFGVFSSNLTGLTAGTSYYVRAYATNSTGTAYGSQVNLTTISSSECWKKVDVSTSDNFTVGLTNDGKLFAWGYNDVGQLGVGNISNQNIPAQVGTNNDWKTFAVGESNAIAIKNNGTLWTWGSGSTLGDNINIDVNYPIQIGTDVDWKEVAAGCYHVFAIKNNGTLWGTGSNEYGQLGIGSTIDENIFIQIGTENNWKQISGGCDFTVAVKQDGTLWAWGNNDEGQCGLGFVGSFAKTPYQIGNLMDWDYAEAGGRHVFALKNDATLFAWGAGNVGQLGLGSASQWGLDVPTSLEGTWKYISAGSDHSTAVKSDGSLWVWGGNFMGALGIGYTDGYLNTPFQNGTSLDWKEVHNGGYNSTAIRNDGSLYAWGNNEYGQIGNGTTGGYYQLSPLVINCPVYSTVLNDNCTDAIILTQKLSCIPISGTTVNATQSIPAIICGGYTGTADDDVWYKFNALSADPTITVAGDPGFDAVVELLSGSCDGTNISCADFTGSGGAETINAAGLTIGAPYYVRIYSYSIATNGIFTICVSGTPSATGNDNSTSANILTQNTICTESYGSTINSTQSDNTNECGGNADDDVWFSFVAKSETPIITVVGSNLFNPVLELLNDTKVNITCSNATGNGGAEIINAMGLEIDSTYYIRVFSFGTDTYGTFSICVSGSFNTNDIFENEVGNQINIFPNPVSNELTIEIRGNKEVTGFEILNSLGQVAFNGNLVEKATISTSNFAPGIYLIKLINGKTFKFKKIIKE